MIVRTGLLVTSAIAKFDTYCPPLVAGFLLPVTPTLGPRTRRRERRDFHARNAGTSTQRVQNMNATSSNTALSDAELDGVAGGFSFTIFGVRITVEGSCKADTTKDGRLKETCTSTVTID